MPKVSVIIPVYGVEKYIERCARSLFEQTLDDMEFIFIDDCTTDKSIAILKRVMNDYPERSKQTRIEKMAVNSGLPAVRKYGISVAKGEYIIACDSDDYVERNMYEIMYGYASQECLDLVHCDIDVVNDKGIVYSLSCKQEYLSSDELKNRIINGAIANSLCNKLVRRNIYQSGQISFPKYGIDEDNTVAVQLAYFSRKLKYIHHSYYKAYQNMDSMSRIHGREQILKRFNESCANSNLLIGFLRAHSFDEKSLAIVKVKIRPKLKLWPIVDNKELLNLWKSTYSEINYPTILDFRFSYKIRLKFLLMMSYVLPIINILKNFFKRKTYK